MVNVSLPITLLVILCFASVHGALVSRKIKQLIPNINFDNSVTKEAQVVHHFGSSPNGTNKKQLTQEIQEHLKNLQPSLKSSRIIVVNGSGGDFQQLIPFMNLPKDQSENIDSVLEKLIPKIDGKWSDWSQWTKCSTTCGEGITIRKRDCIGPINGGKKCEGKKTESERCNAGKCPVDGKWSDWSQWTKCNTACGEGITIRQRDCIGPINGGKKCPGDKKESKTCYGDKCSVAIVFDRNDFTVNSAFGRKPSNYGNTQDYFVIKSSKFSRNLTPKKAKDIIRQYFEKAEKIDIGLYLRPGSTNDDDKRVVRVTSNTGTISSDKEFIYCDEDGKRYKHSEVKAPRKVPFEDPRQRLIMRNGDCPTVIFIQKQNF